MTYKSERCLGGYLVGPGGRLCGRSGNNCVDECCFAWRGRNVEKPSEDTALKAEDGK